MDAILVHGGAGPVSDGRLDHREQACRQAARQGWDALQGGGSPMDAVEAAVVALEDDPVFNAGTGSYLAADGRVYVDAGVMDDRYQVGAVGHVPGVANPVRLARRVAEDDQPHVFFVGEGAYAQADRWDLTVDPDTLVTPDKRKLWEAVHPIQGADTVGAAAVQDGRLAVAQSTGGTPGKALGRIGDAPLPGLGYHAEEGVGAALATGDGEALLKVQAARRAVDAVMDGAALDAACRRVIERMEDRVQGRGGLLALTVDGQVGRAHSTPHMAWGAVVGGDPTSGI